MKYFYYFLVTTLLLWSEHNYSNALVNSSSPYLQQHAHNPVDWYPWGEEALEKAKKENKLIFLSIGYSTCHWCHVMEEESFIDIEVAKLLNDDFISIKVDREEYPHIDKKYQKRYMQRFGKRGGWPLSVFLSPTQELFFLGTYIPKEPGYSSQGLVNILPSFVALQKSKEAFKKEIDIYNVKQPSVNVVTKKTTRSVDTFVEAIAKEYDYVNGGFANRPKFPEASKLELLLDMYIINGNKKALQMAENTLRKMAQSGLYDQIGGGFFRYVVDKTWQTPHFEKMLYTNAELIAVYVKLYKMTGDALYKKVVDETIAQMEKNYLENGLYLSASDADSDGEEGGYFIYEYVEVKAALKEQGWKSKEIEDTLAYLGIEEDGNIDGDFSHTHITSEKKPARVDELKAYLKSISDARTFPFLDKKINTAWSSMMIKALFVASSIDEHYLELAIQRLDTLLTTMRKKGVLYHQKLYANVPKQEGLLEDYAFMIDALLEGYSKTYNGEYLALAQTLADEALLKFYRNKSWYLSNDGIKALADFDDKYYTSALSLLLENLVKLTSLTEILTYSDIVKETLTHQGDILDTNPAYASKLVHTYLRLKKGDVIIHASRDKLLLAQDVLVEVQYPFLLSKTQETDEYLACKTTMCFAHDLNITKLIDKINKAVN